MLAGKRPVTEELYGWKTPKFLGEPSCLRPVTCTLQMYAAERRPGRCRAERRCVLHRSGWHMVAGVRDGKQRPRSRRRTLTVLRVGVGHSACNTVPRELARSLGRRARAAELAEVAPHPNDKPRLQPWLQAGHRLVLMGLGGVEPPTSRLSGVRSNHLSYRPRESREM